MGKLIREKDWSKTPLGPPEQWPQSLRTMVSVMLDAKNAEVFLLYKFREYFSLAVSLLISDHQRFYIALQSHPVQLINIKIAHQKLDYIHYNPVEAGFVTKPEEWKYSSAMDYFGGKGLLEIMRLDALIV